MNEREGQKKKERKKSKPIGRVGGVGVAARAP